MKSSACFGPNGAGKTTTFYMIVGLVASDGGEVYLDDDRITHFPIHRRAHMGVSYLPQEASVFRKLTVTENIKAVLELQKLSRTKCTVRWKPCSRTCTSPTSATTRRHRCRAVSGDGWKLPARWRHVRASSCSTRPFAGVDPIAVLEIQKIIRFLKERNIGVLITDHNVRETLGICDRAFIINEGSVLASGTRMKSSIMKL